MAEPLSAARPSIRLGLIGDNIAASRTPRLHEMVGGIIGHDVRYDRLVPRQLGLDFDAVFERAQAEGFRGLNVTYPYKERAVARVRVDDARVRRLGAINTVLFEPDGPVGHNTDYTGFLAAYRKRFGSMDPGPVCLLGAGGVGRAIAFGLVELGCRDLRVVEKDLGRAEAVAEALGAAMPDLRVQVSDDAAAAAQGAQGFVNGTPVGMVGYPGTPIRAESMAGGRWAFDAVYTPTDTQFLADAARMGLEVLSGWELFFYQGFHCIGLFNGVTVDEATVRAALAAEAG